MWRTQRVTGLETGVSAVAGSTAGALAVVDGEGRLHLGTVDGGLRPRRDLRFDRVVGLSCRDGVCVVVQADGRRTDVSPAGVVVSELGPVRGWTRSADGTVSAAITSDPSALYRSDAVQVWDEPGRRPRRRIDPPCADCVEVDRIDLDPAGRRVAWTGLAVAYSSDGDWIPGQSRRLGVADTTSAAVVLDVEVGRTHRPDDHEPVALALGRAHVLAGEYLVPAGTGAHDPDGPDTDVAEVGREVLPARPDLVAALPGRGGFVVATGDRIAHLRAETGVGDAARLPAAVATLGALPGGVLAADVDGAVWCLTDDPPA